MLVGVKKNVAIGPIADYYPGVRKQANKKLEAMFVRVSRDAKRWLVRRARREGLSISMCLDIILAQMRKEEKQ